VTSLLLCAEESLQDFQILHVVLLASRRVKHRGGCSISSSQAGPFCWSNAAGVGRGARGGIVVQHLRKKESNALNVKRENYL